MLDPAAMNKKPSSFRSQDYNISMVVGGLVVMAIVGVIYYFYADSSRRSMVVEVYMDKQCELIDGAFMAMAEPDGARANFDKGLAVLNTFSDSRIVIRSNSAYPSFSYESAKVKASPKVVIPVQCETGRIDKTLDAMRQQFRSRER